MNLTKQQAIDIFGSRSALARALGKTKAAISQWPDQLNAGRTALVIYTAAQLGKQIPRGGGASVGATGVDPSIEVKG
jgi:DNA-binding transcriptional regulator YdaS (Cro superfamily)